MGRVISLRTEDRHHVVENLLGLDSDIVLSHLSRRGIEGNLAGDKQEFADADSGAVRPDHGGVRDRFPPHALLHFVPDNTAHLVFRRPAAREPQDNGTRHCQGQKRSAEELRASVQSGYMSVSPSDSKTT